MFPHLYPARQRSGLVDQKMLERAIAHRSTLPTLTRNQLGLGYLTDNQMEVPIASRRVPKPPSRDHQDSQQLPSEAEDLYDYYSDYSSMPESVEESDSSEEEDEEDEDELGEDELDEQEAAELEAAELEAELASAELAAATQLEEEEEEEEEKEEEEELEEHRGDIFEPRSFGQEGKFLTDEQRMVWGWVVLGFSVFIAGSAGTGKSFMVRLLIELLRTKHPGPRQIAVTASTGLAAFGIGGYTLHSWAGVGYGLGTLDVHIKRIKKYPAVMQRWIDVVWLFIDEVSMVHADLFDLLHGLACYFRNSSKPFGGIKLIITGDALQLPAIAKKSKKGGTAPFFLADNWEKCMTHKIRFRTILRQNEPKYIAALNNIRIGHTPPETIRFFRRLDRAPPWEDDEPCVELFCTRADVADRNIEMLEDLPGTMHQFLAEDSFQYVKKNTKAREDRLRLLVDKVAAPEELLLKVNAVVMHLKNDPANKLVNGSLGKVLRFVNYRGDKVQTWNRSSTDPHVYPVVEWEQLDGTTIEVPMIKSSWKAFDREGNSVRRVQYPMMLAWALTIHKSQGLTLDRAIVHLKRSFSTGLVYVALSRTRSVKGLVVYDFNPKKVLCNQIALQYEQGLYVTPLPFPMNLPAKSLITVS